MKRVNSRCDRLRGCVEDGMKRMSWMCDVGDVFRMGWIDELEV